MPGRHSFQARLDMRSRTSNVPAIAAAKPGSVRAPPIGLKPIRGLPSQKEKPRGRRRPDPLAEVSDSGIVPMLEAAPEPQGTDVALTGDRSIQRLPVRKRTPISPSFIVGEVNAGLFSSFLNLEHCGKASFHHAFALLDPLKRRQADPGGASKLTLAPAQEPPRCPYLRRVSHQFAGFLI